MSDGSLIARSDVPVVFADQMHMAQVLAESTLLPAALRGKPANVLLILTGARALDIPAFWALQSMHVIEGKLSQAADLMRALVIRAGHTFRVVERTREKAVVEIKRRDRATPYRAEFTWQDATDAELTGKANWKKYPQAMLVARATSIAVRDECPDLLYGVVYTPDELGAVTDDDGNPVLDGEIVTGQTVRGPDVLDLAEALTVAMDPDSFAEVWREVAPFAPAPILDEIGGNLFDRAVAITCGRVRAAEKSAEIRAWWDALKPFGLLEGYCPPTPEAKMDDPPSRLGDYILARGKFLKGVEDAQRLAREADLRDNPVTTVDLPAEDVPPLSADVVADGDDRISQDQDGHIHIDTAHARKMRAAARDTWGDGPIPPTGDDA